MSAAFRPLPLVEGGHRQTIIGHLLRMGLRWRRAATDVVIEAPDDARLLLRASWQPDSSQARPAVLVVHGLEGSDGSGYTLSLAELAFQEGWHVVRMNLRGCGDSEPLCPRLYNAGLTADLLPVLEWLAQQVKEFVVCGFSLGGNLALLAAARHRESLPDSLRALVAVSPPLDLGVCADRLAEPENRLYQAYFLRKLRRAYQRRQGRLPHLYSADRDRPYRTIREYDDAITAPYGGYAGVSDYYARSSAGPHLSAIERPALILAAADDPLIPETTVSRWPTGGRVTREITPTGGHVGFVGREGAPGFFWAARRALDFAGQHVSY